MKGLLMTSDNIRATAERRKWQTRRIEAKLKIINQEPSKWHLAEFYQATGGDGEWWAWFSRDGDGKPYVIKPRYQIGEIVYIKEAWAYIRVFDGIRFTDEYKYIYRLDEPDFNWYDGDGAPAERKDGNPASYWQSPMFLKAENARYFVKINGILPQRLQDITVEEIIAEGIERGLTKIGYYYAFGQLWNSINRKHKIDLTTNLKTVYPYSWEANPWIWAYSYELLDGKSK